MSRHPLFASLLLIAAAPSRAPAQSVRDGAGAFLEWARKHAQVVGSSAPGADTRDLVGLRAIVGNARVVGVGESAHGIREFLGLRQRVTQFLVERMGFTAVALETGLPDSRIVYD